MTSPDSPERIAVSANEAAAMLSIGRDAVFELVLSGAIRSFKIGSRRLIPVSALHEFVEAQSNGTTNESPARESGETVRDAGDGSRRNGSTIT